MLEALPPQPCASTTVGVPRGARAPHVHVAMKRPLCSIEPARASIRSSALCAAYRARGGVRNMRSAIAPAKAGSISRAAVNRTFVLILGRRRLACMDELLRFSFGLAGRAQPA